MTYSQSVRQELCRAKLGCAGCGYALAYAMLLFGRNGQPRYIFQSDHKQSIELLAQEIVEHTGVIVTIIDDRIRTSQKSGLFALTVENPDDLESFQKTFSGAVTGTLEDSVLRKPCCRAAFFRGAFLACGVIVDPQKEYHFEFAVKTVEKAQLLLDLLQQMDYPFKLSRRKQNYIVYLKESEHIEEILTYIGACKNALNLMDVKILKDIRNKVNRTTNCETANIQRAVAASVRQVNDIRFILEQKGASFLPDDLREVASARLENPDMSLRELCEVIPSGISRSGLNHRLKKLLKLAEELRNSK